MNAVEKRWLFDWQKKQFKGKKNPDLWIRFLKLYKKHRITFHWVKGHNHHSQNERCDFLAVEASKKEQPKIDQYYENVEKPTLNLE